MHLGIHKCGKGTERNSRIIGRIRYPLALGVLDEYLAGKAIFGSPQLRAIVIDVEPGGVHVVILLQLPDAINSDPDIAGVACLGARSCQSVVAL